MRPDFLLDSDLVVIMVRRLVLVLSFGEGEPFVLGSELIERGGAGDSVNGFLVGLDVEDGHVVALVVEGIGASLY